MSEQLQVVITGKDGVSRVFQEIAKEAKTAGSAVESAAKDGSQGLKQLDQAADKADKSVKQSGQSARQSAIDFDMFGAAAIAVGGFLTIAGNSALDQIQTIEGLKSAYGDAADEMLAFADQMASTTIFNDDDVLRGERYFATLKNNYDLSIDQVQQLMQTTADLASAYGTSFEDASNRITAAIRGEGEAAEFLGLTMNQQAIDRDNLTLTMSNQEAAAFRLNALYAQTDVYAGTAQRLVQTEVGSRARLTNMIQDNTQALANMIGPYNAIIAGSATGAVGLAQFAGGFSSLSSMIKTATTASLAFIATPLGMTVTLVGTTLAAATTIFLQHRQAAQETAAAWAEAEAAGESLTDQITQMALAGDGFNARFSRGLQDTIFGESGDGGQLNWFKSMVGDLSVEDMNQIWQGNYDNLDEFWTNVVNDPDFLALPDDFGRRREYIEALMPTAEDEIALNEALGNLFALFTNPNIDSAELQRQMQEIYRLWDEAPDGSVTIDDLIASFVALEQQTVDNLMTTEKWTAAQDVSTASTWDYIDAVNGASTVVAEHTATAEDDTAAMERQAAAMMLVVTATGLLNSGMDPVISKIDEMGESLVTSGTATMESGIALGEWVTMIQSMGSGALTGAIDASAVAIEIATKRAGELRSMLISIMGLDDPLTQWSSTSYASDMALAADSTRDAASALDDLYRVVVGNTDAIANQVSGINDWATALIGAEGEVAELDKAYARWIASGMDAAEAQERWNDAQEAQTSIAASNAAIQEHITDIQLMQAPLIAESTAALEQQLGVIAEMPAQQQLVALSWMDSASAAKALEIATMATAVANGELGASGEEAFSKYLTGMAAVDPVMKALLIDMGLISEGADGTITVHLDGAEGAMSEIEMLTSAIVALIDLMDNGVIDGSFSLTAEDNATPVVNNAWDYLDSVNGATSTVYVEGDNGGAMGALNDAADALRGLNGDSATVNILANDAATGVIAGARAALDALNGRTATSYIRTVYQSIGSPRQSDYDPAAHGGMAGYAMGGNVVPIWASENGTELAHFPTGGVVPLVGEGIHHVPVGSYIETAPSARDKAGGGGISFGPFIIQGNVYGVDDLAAEIMAPVADQLAAEMERKKVAAGVAA